MLQGGKKRGEGWRCDAGEGHANADIKRRDRARGGEEPGGTCFGEARMTGSLGDVLSQPVTQGTAGWKFSLNLEGQ